MPPRLPAAFVAFALLAGPQISSAAVAIEVSGLDEEELEVAVRQNLHLNDYADRSLSRAEADRLFSPVEQEATEALEPYGYYHATAAAKLERGEKDGDYRVTVRMTRGEPVIVSESSVVVDEAALAIPSVRATVDAFHPRVGERLQHGLYEGGKNAIGAALRLAGYFDSQLTTHRVEVVGGANTAKIDLAWKTGERYRFGDVHFPDTQFSDDFLRRYIPWRANDFYSTDKLLELQQRFVDADYFSAVSVQPDIEHAANGVVPIDTLLVPAKRTIYKVGAYVSTDSGPGVRLGVDRRWINDRGHKIGGEVEYSQRLQAASTFYRIPRPGERNRNYNLAAGYRDEETDSSTSRTARISANEVLDRWYGYTRTLGLQYLNGDFTIAEEQRSSSLLFAEGSLTRKRADDLLFPGRGVSVMYLARFAVEGALSDTSLAQVRADAKWVRPSGKRSRIILRASLGAMTVDDFDALPPELRFFAGGDRSLRGFDYQQLGETNAEGGVIGGKYLTVASAEFEYYFLPKWGAAVFVDGGDAFSTRFEANVGAGIGLRWRSPVGIVRLDVAVPVRTDAPDDDGVRLHVVIGPDL